MIPLKDTHSSGKFPFITYFLIAINVVVFLYMSLLDGPLFEAFIEKYALIPAYVVKGERLSTFFTSLFLHGSLLHILSNMLFLKIFGDNIEARFGALRFLFFYFLFGIIGSFAQIIANPNSILPNLGASGAIAGVMGSYLYLFPKARIKVLLPLFIFWQIITVPAFLMLGYWFLIQTISGIGEVENISQDMGGVAYFSHIGGFLSGFLITKGLKKNNKI